MGPNKIHYCMSLLLVLISSFAYNILWRCCEVIWLTSSPLWRAVTWSHYLAAWSMPWGADRRHIRSLGMTNGMHKIGWFDLAGVAWWSAVEFPGNCNRALTVANMVPCGPVCMRDSSQLQTTWVLLTHTTNAFVKLVWKPVLVKLSRQAVSNQFECNPLVALWSVAFCHMENLHTCTITDRWEQETQLLNLNRL